MLSIIGAGKWGQALAYAIAKNHDVALSSRTTKDLPNFVSMQQALQAKYLIITIPAQHIRSWLQTNPIRDDQKVLVAAKGIEIENQAFLNEIYAPFVKEENIAFISGPSFAKEVMSDLPTAIVINAKNRALASEFASFFPRNIKTYVSDDVIGAEVAGAYKNVIAIAGGVCDGLGLGNNARAALISRGLVEMSRFGSVFGAKEQTFLGLSGAGDLFLTASSNLSRNYRVGYYLAQGQQLDAILEKLGEVAEGVYTTKALYKISTTQDIYVPIAKEVYQLLEGKNPKQSLQDLLSS
ncbi:MAG: NAD(P)H-dependent glycerol-3-phosphate dehydrogenase [Campylobacterota bacterium]